MHLQEAPERDRRHDTRVPPTRVGRRVRSNLLSSVRPVLPGSKGTGAEADFTCLHLSNPDLARERRPGSLLLSHTPKAAPLALAVHALVHESTVPRRAFSDERPGRDP